MTRLLLWLNHEVRLRHVDGVVWHWPVGTTSVVLVRLHVVVHRIHTTSWRLRVMWHIISTGWHTALTVVLLLAGIWLVRRRWLHLGVRRCRHLATHLLLVNAAVLRWLLSRALLMAAAANRLALSVVAEASHTGMASHLCLGCHPLLVAAVVQELASITVSRRVVGGMEARLLLGRSMIRYWC